MNNRKLLLVITVSLLSILFVSCSQHNESIVLRFNPEVGRSYRYQFRTNTIGAPIALHSEMQVLSMDDHGFKIRFSGIVNELFSGELNITDRHNSSHPGYISLNFPNDPVIPGETWDGEIPWYYEDYYVLEPREIRLPATYTLISIESEDEQRLAFIEQRIDADIAIDDLVFYVGQVGVAWDHQGTITDVHKGYAASGRLQEGDVVMGINGHITGRSEDLKLLAEKFIQHPKQDKMITFTVMRNGEKLDVEAEKTIDRFAVVKVTNKRDVINIIYDIDRQIIQSVEVSSSYDVSYTSPSADPFPVVDSYDGFHKFGYLKGLTFYQEHMDSNGIAWSMTLDE